MSSTQQLLLGEGAGGSIPVYIEEVFSTYLYTGTGATQSITNNIDVTGKGALVWLKRRNSTNAHFLFDTARGVNTGVQALSSNTTDEGNAGADIAFTSTGFTLTQTGSNTNGSGATYVSWTFRKQPKFFDVVTYTGNGSATNNISHNLQSIPGFIIAKRTDAPSNWVVCSRFTDTNYSGGNGAPVIWSLNSEDAAGAGVNPTTRGITSTTINVTNLSGTSPSFDTSVANVNGASYVMYLFAHNAGGFGLTGTDNVISCGGYTGNGGLNTINLGYEAQWVMIKNADTTGATSDWGIYNNMSGMFNAQVNTPSLNANESAAETSRAIVYASQTGFTIDDASGRVNGSGTSYVYIAIRRGPMAVPTVGTNVYNAVTRSGTGADATVTASISPVDLLISKSRNSARNVAWWDRLRGRGNQIYSTSTAANIFRATSLTGFDVQDGYTVGADGDNLVINESGGTYVNWGFRRAPGFFDEVCYTGTGGSLTLTHNLGVVPELAICKSRSDSDNWEAAVVDPSNPSQFFVGQNSGAQFAINLTNGWGTNPFITADYLTATTFKAGTWWDKGVSARTYVAYLFATCAGVSKVGSYTGTGTTLQVNCGFTGGARFVLIKRTDSTGDWYVWDSARGIIAGNDPYLLLNDTAAEVTGTDYVDTYSAGFEITSTAPAAINANGGTYIFLAIA